MAKQPALWQMSHPKYKYQGCKEIIWGEIAEKVGKSAEDCKKRWRNIRDAYEKSLKKEHPVPPTGRTSAIRERLSFLHAGDHKKRLSNVNGAGKEDVLNAPEVEVKDFDIISCVQTPEEPSQSHSPSTSTFPQQISTQRSSNKIRRTNDNCAPIRTKKRGILADLKRPAERNALLKNLVSVEETTDELDLFFKSITKSVRKLPPDLQHRAKIETLCTLGKLEAETRASLKLPCFVYEPAPSPTPSVRSVCASTENHHELTSLNTEFCN